MLKIVNKVANIIWDDEKIWENMYSLPKKFKKGGNPAKDINKKMNIL
jgi:hypothetical protein